MGMDRLRGAGVLQYIRSAITSIIRPESAATANNRLRRDRVNDRLFDQVIGKFGKQTPYDRSLIRSEIEKARQDANAARADARRYERIQTEGQRTQPIPPPRPAPVASYNVDIIIRYRTSDGTIVAGRVTLEDVPGGTMDQVRKRLDESGVLDDLFGGGVISFKRNQRQAASEPPTFDNITKIDILSKTRL